jgi:hypothetical protein
MNMSPTALLVGLLLIIVVVSLFGGYFGYLTGDNNIFSTQPPNNLWGLITDAGSFYWALLTINIAGLPYIFSVVWWVINALGLYSVVKIIWP